MLLRTALDLGRYVREQRTRRAWTQAELAERTGVSRKWLIDLESGKRAADLSLVLRTLNALDVELHARTRDERHDTNASASEIDDIVARSQLSRASRTPSA